MSPGHYLTFEPRRGDLIRQAAAARPVIVQQFYEGVGFRDGWVNFWEHPMPREMWRSFSETYRPDAGIAGVYGSPFELRFQFVDLRLSMEWGWTPTRDPRDILREYGNEQFGPGVGRDFAEAMFGMEEYWNRETRRFHFDDGNLTDAALVDVTRSLATARRVAAALARSRPLVLRNAEDYRGFVDLATVMGAAAEYWTAAARADRLSWEGATKPATRAARDALLAAERAVDVTRNSTRYAWLLNHPFWEDWDLGDRPARLRRLIRDLEQAAGWVAVAIGDAGAEEHEWGQSGEGSMAYVEQAHTGRSAVRVSATPGNGWCVVHPPQPISVPPNQVWRLEFWARAERGKPRLYVDWYADSADGENCEVGLEDDGQWHRCRLDVRTPDMPAPGKLTLRFVAYGSDQQLLLDDVKAWRPAP